MISSLQIRNFRCLRDVDLDLGPLTVLVGGNSSGKSSVFHALVTGFGKDDHWARDHTQHISVTVTDSQSGVHLRTSRDAVPPSWWPHTQILQLDLKQLRMSLQLAEQRELGQDGYGLANLFASLTRRQQDEVATAFCHLVPLFRDVNHRPSSQGNHRVVFQDRWHESVWYEPNQVSDGTILMLAFLLLQYQSPAPDLIAIEEPERGLHPFLMSELVQTLRRLAHGEFGPKPVQVLLATHSADLLEFVEPHEVRFLNRSRETGETKVQLAPTNDPTWPRLLREYDNSLGDLWLTGGLGGVPGG